MQKCIEAMSPYSPPPPPNVMARTTLPSRLQGLKVPEDSEEYEAVELALRWKRRLYQHRYLETRYATRTTRGLREVGKVKSDPSLTDLMTKDMPFGRSP